MTLYKGTPSSKSKNYISKFMLDTLETKYPQATVKGNKHGIKVVTVDAPYMPIVRGIRFTPMTESKGNNDQTTQPLTTCSTLPG